MKLVKNFVFTALLVSTLAFNTMAGETQLPGFVPPPPPRQFVADDEAQTPSGTDTQQTEPETTDNLLYEALAALLSVY